MQTLAAKEQRTDPSLQLHLTQAYKLFSDLCGSLAEKIPFLKVNDKDIEKLEKMYKTHPPDIYEFAKKYVFPAVTLHPRKLASTPYNLENMFMETQGFTGTPWNALTFPQRLETLRDRIQRAKPKESSGKTALQCMNYPLRNLGLYPRHRKPAASRPLSCLHRCGGGLEWGRQSNSRCRTPKNTACRYQRDPLL